MHTKLSLEGYLSYQIERFGEKDNGYETRKTNNRYADKRNSNMMFLRQSDLF